MADLVSSSFPPVLTAPSTLPRSKGTSRLPACVCPNDCLVLGVRRGTRGTGHDDGASRGRECGGEPADPSWSKRRRVLRAVEYGTPGDQKGLTMANRCDFSAEGSVAPVDESEWSELIHLSR